MLPLLNVLMIVKTRVECKEKDKHTKSLDIAQVDFFNGITGSYQVLTKY